MCVRRKRKSISGGRYVLLALLAGLMCAACARRDPSTTRNLGQALEQSTRSSGAGGQPGAIYLARHGQTGWNRVHRFQGDPDLDATGYVQRLGLWLLFRQIPLTAIYTSALQRTQRTAALISKAKRLPLRARAALNESDAGVFEGICYSLMDPDKASARAKDCIQSGHHERSRATRQAIQEIWQTYQKQGLRGRLPLGESFFDMVERARSAVREIRIASQKGSVLVVGHSLINRVVLHLLLGWTPEMVHRLRQANDQVYRIEGVRSRQPKVWLYTPGSGWKQCSSPTRGAQVHLDCGEGEGSSEPDKIARNKSVGDTTWGGETHVSRMAKVKAVPTGHP